MRPEEVVATYAILLHRIYALASQMGYTLVLIAINDQAPEVVKGYTLLNCPKEGTNETQKAL